MASPVTLKEMAELLKLAPSTVSKALSGHPDISQATRQRVEALARELDYRPSSLALGLRKKKSYLLAVIVPSIMDYFYAGVVHGIIDLSRSNGYRIVVFESDESVKQEIDICHSLRKSGFDGLFVAPADTGEEIQHLRELQANGMPLLIFDRITGGIDSDKVVEDDFNGAYEAVSYMIAGGCRRIAHLAVAQRIFWAQKRQMGYIQAQLDHSLIVDRALIAGYGNLYEIDGIVERLVRTDLVDGIFAVNDESGVRVLNVLHRMGVGIPGEVAVCGFGDSPLAVASYPALTTIERNGKRMGEVAAGLLLERIGGYLPTNTVTKLLRNGLIVRDSTRMIFGLSISCG